MICTGCGKPASTLHTKYTVEVDGVRDNLIPEGERFCDACAVELASLLSAQDVKPPPQRSDRRLENVRYKGAYHARKP